MKTKHRTVAPQCTCKNFAEPQPARFGEVFFICWHNYNSSNKRQNRYKPTTYGTRSQANGKNKTHTPPIIMRITTAAKKPLPSPKASVQPIVPRTNSTIATFLLIWRLCHCANHCGLSGQDILVDVLIHSKKPAKNKKQQVVIILFVKRYNLRSI